MKTKEELAIREEAHAVESQIILKLRDLDKREKDLTPTAKTRIKGEIDTLAVEHKRLEDSLIEKK